MKLIKISLLLMLLIFVTLRGDDSELLYDDSEVAQVEITVDPADMIWMYNNVYSDSLHNATIHFSNPNIDETVEDVGFRLRGNTSRISWKKSFKLSFNGFVPGREFYDVDKMNLNGEHNDPSIIRSKLCWDIFQNIGMTSSRAAYTEVYINDAYYGLYMNIEHYDDEFLAKNFEDDSGNLWKCNYLARLNYLGEDPDLYKFMDNGQRVYELKRNEELDDYSQLARLIDVLNNTPANAMMDSLETMLDVTGVLKYFAINVLTGSWDDYWYGKNNYYIYHEPSQDKFYIFPYDYDNTFGVDWMNIDWTERDIYVFKHPDADRPLADVFMENDQYHNLYTHFLEFYADNLYDLPLWESRIDSLKDMITASAEADSFRTYDYGFTIADFHNSYSATGYNNQHVKKGIKQFIIERIENLQQQLYYVDADPVLYALDWQETPVMPDVPIPVQISAFSNAGLDQVALEFYPEDDETPQIYQMEFDPVNNTTIIEESDRWTGSIPPLGDLQYGWFQIRATDLVGAEQVFPRSHRIQIQRSNASTGTIFINEFLASNSSTNPDEAGEYDDWLELYNPGDEAYDLSGHYLTDHPDNPLKWQFPDDIIIPAQSWLLIWCDEDQEQGDLHTNFKLSADGEDIVLTHSDGNTTLDAINFSEQSSDISYGRIPDGSELWGFMQPSPGNANDDVSSDPEALPSSLALANYPNPFNPITSITFNLAKPTHINLDIYNPRGQKVTTLTNSLLESGTHQVIWNGKDDQNKSVSSGIYFYKLSLDHKTSAIRKCLLLK